MPSLQEIRQFNARLTSMGNEPEVVREWGEDLEDVPVPEAGLDDDLSSLLSDTGDLSDVPMDDFLGAPTQEPSGPTDYDALVAEEAGSGSAFDDTPETPADEGFDIGDFDLGAGDADAAGGADEMSDFASPDDDATGAVDEAADFGAGSDAGDLDAQSGEPDFGFAAEDDLTDDFDFGDMDFGTPEEDDVSGEIDVTGGADEPSDFDLDRGAEAPDFDLGGAETADFGAGPEIEAGDDFAGSFDDEAFGSDAEPGGAEAPTSDDFDFGAGAEFGDDFGASFDEALGSGAEPGDADAPADEDDFSFDDAFLGDKAEPSIPDDTSLSDDFSIDEEPQTPVDRTIDEGDFSDFEALLGGDNTQDTSSADEEDDFSLPEGGLSFDDEAGEELGEGFDAESSDDDLASDDFGLGDFDSGGGATAGFEDEIGDAGLGDFDAGGFDAGAFEESDEALGAGPSAETRSDDLGDFGSFEFSDEEEDVASAFGGGDEGDEEFGFDEPSVPGADAGLDDVGDLDEVGDDDLDEFSLGDFGAEFGVLESGPSDEDLNPAINIPEVQPGTAELAAAGPGQFQLNETDFAQLKQNLASLPLNLKQSVEQIIAEAKGTTDDVERVCRLLVEGVAAQELANVAGRILGTRIRIPRGYEKRTGEEFEQVRQSFAYQFRENIWPVLRLALLFVVVAGVLAYGGYQLIYRPLYAHSLYAEGVELIEANQYTLGNQRFDRAWEVWESPEWYYTYADAFVKERQYTLAQEKYDQLLFGRNADGRAFAKDKLGAGDLGTVVNTFEPPKRGVLAYAALESETLADYQAAHNLLSLILYTEPNDYDARLALGDNYMRWSEEDPSHHEAARLSYARLMERYGQTDPLLFRMMRYFIARDNLQEVVRLKDAFQADPHTKIIPEFYAELAGYLIDNNQLDGVEDVVFRALDVDSSLPELHYQLARYYRAMSLPGEEDLALRTAKQLLESADPFTASRRGMLIDTDTRIGENQYAAANYLDAQESFTSAIKLYEEGRDRRILGADATYARAYARLGDIYYYVGRDYDNALAEFDAAEANGYHDSNLDYKQGFVHYRDNRLDDALREFRQAAEDPKADTNALLWATANTYYRRDNLFAAEAYYRELIDRVERARDSIKTLLVDEDSRHRSIIEYMFRGYNNLGATLYALSEQTGDPKKYSESLVYLTQSTELAENYQRDPETLTRSDAVDLAYLNQREALYPRPDYEMQIYNMIPEDLDDLLF